MQALLLDFEAHGREAIEKCRKQSPLGYVKVLGHLVPREMKVEHSQSLKSMSDEELEAAIELVRGMLAARAGDEAKVIEGTAEPVSMLAHAELEQPQRKRPNRLLEHADTAVGRRSASRGTACRRLLVPAAFSTATGWRVADGHHGARARGLRSEGHRGAVRRLSNRPA